jgi:hypothetical protein
MAAENVAVGARTAILIRLVAATLFNPSKKTRVAISSRLAAQQTTKMKGPTK